MGAETAEVVVLERDLHEEEDVGALLERALVILRLRPALRGDALLDVALPLRRERRALSVVVEVELLAPACRGDVFALVLDHLHARALSGDEEREDRRRPRRRLVVEEHRVELRLARLRDREEHGLRAHEEMRVARGQQVAAPEDGVGT
jgi:hypothetical protein